MRSRLMRSSEAPHRDRTTGPPSLLLPTTTHLPRYRRPARPIQHYPAPSPWTGLCICLLAPEGPSRVARGASPWKLAVLCAPSPGGATSVMNLDGYVAPPGLQFVLPVVNQGLTTLATRRGPSGAKSFAMPGAMPTEVRRRGHAISMRALAHKAASLPCRFHSSRVRAHRRAFLVG
jgi:hypothetical protein